MPLVFSCLIALAGISSPVLSRSGKSGLSCLVLDRSKTLLHTCQDAIIKKGGKRHIYFRKKGREGERGEEHQCERETSIGGVRMWRNWNFCPLVVGMKK